jgi:hypothetical protein
MLNIFGKGKSELSEKVLKTLLEAAEYERDTHKYTALLEQSKLRPSSRLPVAYFYDGDMWVCAYCYGIEQYPPHIPEEFNMGAAPQGAGLTPEEAALAFDSLWLGVEA